MHNLNSLASCIPCHLCLQIQLEGILGCIWSWWYMSIRPLGSRRLGLEPRSGRIHQSTLPHSLRPLLSEVQPEHDMNIFYKVIIEHVYPKKIKATLDERSNTLVVNYSNTSISLSCWPVFSSMVVDHKSYWIRSSKSSSNSKLLSRSLALITSRDVCHYICCGWLHFLLDWC